MKDSGNDFVSLSGARRPSMRQSDGNMVFPSDGRSPVRRSSMRATDGYAHDDEPQGGGQGASLGRRSSMRATEGNLEIADDHIERHIARTLAIAASRRRASLMQVGDTIYKVMDGLACAEL